MRYQRNNGCGPAAVVNAAKALGIRVRHPQATKASGAGHDGVDETGIMQAVRDAGLSARPFSSNDRKESWDWLRGALVSGRVVILCVDSWSHWVLTCGLLGVDRIILIDSTRSERNKRENGIHVLTYHTLVRRWWNARQWANGERRLYAICVGKN